MNKNLFKFKKNDQIGAASAEQDTEYLPKCFVNTGALDLLKQIDDIRQIVLGRTGAGKSALLTKLDEDISSRSIVISPEGLALAYVSNSTILNYFSDIGVNLDPFFKLLWRHVLTIEILNYHLERENDTKKNLLDRLSSMFISSSRSDKKMREAIKYLSTWGEKFWVETEYRVKEITETLESKLDVEAKASVGIAVAKLASGIRSGAKLTKEQKTELCSRAQRVVSAVQVQDLHNVLELLDNVLEDRQKNYYILIDRLDENWVEERLRYKLIMALVLTARDFIKVRNAKIVIALRRDLIDRVFRLARDSGFQEEKFQSLYLPLIWTGKELIEVLDLRINELVKHRYTGQKVTHKDLLPNRFEKKPIAKYISMITSNPRDIIAFFNSCISVAIDQPKLTSQLLKEAVGKYSRSRLYALRDEWSADYPSLLDCTKLLYHRPASFKMSAIEDNDVEELCLTICADTSAGSCIFQNYAIKVVDCVTTVNDFKIFLMQVFYIIGLIGLKLHPHESVSWVEESGKGISPAEINNNISISVHPKYHRVLGINSKAGRNQGHAPNTKFDV